jgi:poly(3-hydroxyalkanoate) depolymerase
VSAEPAAPAPRQVGFADVAGVRLRYSVSGEGRPLLLVMGVGAPLDLWGPFEAGLNARGICTVAFDAPGTGQSGLLRTPVRMAGLARLTVRLLDFLEFPEVDVLGVSFGGALAQEIVHQAPDRVRRLVLAATACGLGGVPGHPRVLLRLATPRRYYSRDYWARVAPSLYGGRVRREPELMRKEAVIHMGRPPSVLGYAGQLYAITGWSSLPWLHRLRQPTLVLAGDDDPIVPLVNGRMLAGRIPGARLEVIRGGGHLFLLEEAETMAGLVAGFLGAA